VIGFVRHIAEQLIEIVETSLQDDAIIRDAGREDQSFAVRVEPHEAAQRRRHLRADASANHVTGAVVRHCRPAS
jgi:hypothetical protein